MGNLEGAHPRNLRMAVVARCRRPAAAGPTHGLGAPGATGTTPARQPPPRVQPESEPPTTGTPPAGSTPPGSRPSSGRASAMPANIASTNTHAEASALASDTSAGPGQYPDRPQPTPNSTAPRHNRRSTCRASGHTKRSPNAGASRPRTSRYTQKFTPTAPPITNSKLGSQAPVTSRNPS